MHEISEIISHPGTVEKIDEGNIFVRIKSISACSSCHAKSACSMAEMQEKIVGIKRDKTVHFKVGNQVNVVLEKSLGRKAVLLAYLLPLLILILSLVVLTILSVNEGIAAILSILLLVPYYVVLYFFRDRLKRTFEFRIQ